MLADLAVTEPEAFASLVQVANEALADRAGGCRGRFLSQIGLAYTHQRVRRLRQLLRKRSLRERRGGAGRRGTPSCCRWPWTPGRWSRRSTWHPRAGSTDGVAAVVDRAFATGVRVFDLVPGVIERVADTVTPQPVLAVVGFAPAPLEVAAGPVDR